MIEVHPTEMVRVDQLDEMDENPNEMSDDEFSLLVEEILESGWLNPIQVVGPMENGRYQMFGGHHRRRAALVLGMEEVPAVVVSPEQFDDDQRRVQLVKQNILHGKLNPEKFTELYSDLAKRWDADVLRRMMGFTKSDAFEKVFLDAKKQLPPGLAEKLQETRAELRTIDDLSLVLNRLFTEHGETVQFHAMFFSYGGKDHVMVQLQAPGAWGRVKQFVEWCVEEKLMIDEELMRRMDWPR